MEFSHTNSGLSILNNNTTYSESQQSTENNSNFLNNCSQNSNIIKNFAAKNNLYINIPSKIIESKEAAKLDGSNNSNSNFKKSYDYLKLDVNQKRKSMLFSQNTFPRSELSTPISLQAEDFVSDYQVLIKVPNKKQSQFSRTQIQSPLQKYKIYFWQIPNACSSEEVPIVLNLEIADNIIVEKAIKKIIKAFNKFLQEEKPNYGFLFNNSPNDLLQNFEILPAKKNGKPKEDMPSLDFEQLLSMSGLNSIVLVIKDLKQGILNQNSQNQQQQKQSLSSNSKQNQKRKSTGDKPAESSVIIEEKSINLIADSYSSNGILNSNAIEQKKKKQQQQNIVSNNVYEPEQDDFCCKIFSFKNLFSQLSFSASKKKKQSNTTSTKNKYHKATTITNFSSIKK